MLTIAPQLEVMNRLGRAMADPTRSRILLTMLEAPVYTVDLAQRLGLTRSNVSNHLACLRGCGIIAAVPEGRRTRYEIADGHLTKSLTALVDVVLAVDDGAPCLDGSCDVPGCCGSAA
jgi:DNA-binding transcriptional ArsR family regulator